MKSLLKRDHKHIRFCARIATLLLFSAAALFGQSPPDQSDQESPATPPPAQHAQTQHRIRALAVVEVHGAGDNPASAKAAKVQPVLIFYKGAYHDAGVYEASPVPMALEQGTVYELERAGQPAGLITIGQAREQQETWFAAASFVQKRAQTAKTNKSSGDDDERPTLKRGTSAAGESTTAAPANEASAQQAAPAVVHHEASEPPPDTDRPILRRGKPAEEQAAEIPEPAPASSRPTASASGPVSAPQLAGAAAGGTADVRDYAAISDASAYDTRTLAYAWTEREKEEWTAQLAKMAQRKLMEYAESKGLAAKHGDQMQVEDARAFDLFDNNDAQLVMTARQHFDYAITRKQRVASVPTSLDAYVTLVAYRDLDGNLNEIFSTVTDSQRLDVEGRFKLIDAVDVNGDGRAELLFRRVGMDSDRFELYRVGATQIFKLFQGTDFSR